MGLPLDPQIYFDSNEKYARSDLETYDRYYKELFKIESKILIRRLDLLQCNIEILKLNTDWCRNIWIIISGIIGIIISAAGAVKGATVFGIYLSSRTLCLFLNTYIVYLIFCAIIVWIFTSRRHKKLYFYSLYRSIIVRILRERGDDKILFEGRTILSTEAVKLVASLDGKK